MGARQVHRVAGRRQGLALVALLALGVIAGLGGDAAAERRRRIAAAPVGEPLVIIDLRPGDAGAMQTSRAGLADDLDRVQGLAVRRDDGLDAALAGEGADTDAAEVTGALAEAREAYGALDCARARPAAERAIDRLAARQASGLDDGTALRAAWAYVLLCADHDGDRGRAQTAADRLRGLGLTSGEAAGISAATWARYPEIDATVDRDVVELAVTTTPAGAAVWIDHVPVGAAPVTVFVAAGEHVVAAGDGSKRAATRITAAGAPVTAALALVDRTGPYSAVAGLVHGWRDGKLTPTAEGLATVMRTLEVRFALILAGKSTIQVWALGPGDAKARKLDDASYDDTVAIGAMINDRVAAWDGNAPDPDLPLLREGDAPRAGGKRGTPTRWWVYAAIVGAVVAGTTVLYVQDAADDHQHIEIRYP